MRRQRGRFFWPLFDPWSRSFDYKRWLIYHLFYNLHSMELLSNRANEWLGGMRLSKEWPLKEAFSFVSFISCCWTWPFTRFRRYLLTQLTNLIGLGAAGHHVTKVRSCGVLKDRSKQIFEKENMFDIFSDVFSLEFLFTLIEVERFFISLELFLHLLTNSKALVQKPTVPPNL